MLQDGKKPIKGITMRNVLFMITFTIALVLAVVQFPAILKIIDTVFLMIRPFIIGIGLAYIFNIPYMRFYRKMPERWGNKRRPLAVCFAVFLIVAIIGATFIVIIPQVSQNVGTLINTFPQIQQDVMNNVEEFLAKMGLADTVVETFNKYLTEIQTFLMNFAKNLVPTVISTTMNVGSFFINSLLALTTAIYLTASKDKMLRQLKRTLFAILPTRSYTKIVHAGKIANKTFTSYIGGQMIESIIIGVITYVVSTISGMPFAPILGIIIGITNIIPYFGPIIGTGVCAFLILFIDPMKGLLFVVQGIIIQQFEANIIYPRVVGSSVGLSGFWTLVAITIGGGMFGIPGMILGLPAFATFYFLFAEFIRKRFGKKYKVIKEENSEIDIIETFTEFEKIETEIAKKEQEKEDAKQRKKDARKKDKGDHK